MKSLNVKTGEVVSVMLPNVPEMIEAHFGVPMSGAILNTLNTRLEKRSIDEIIDSVWFKDLLEKSWNKNHPLHLPRCFLACGDNGKRAVIKEEYVG